MKSLKYFGLGLALAATVAGPMGTAVRAQVDPTGQRVNWAQAQAVDFGALRSHLVAQNWRAADAETRRILDPWIHPNGDILGTPLATNIPPEVLQTLDQLWVEASGGRFGFSVQQQIWQEAREQNPVDSAVAAKVFGDRVGWTRPPGVEDPTVIAGDWLTEMEINYSLNAPVGHLPWAGVSWAQISKLMSVESCGSCTIDAMYVQGERFTRYIPLLFNWVATAIDIPTPQAGSWQRAQLARSIDLKSLYAESQCPVRAVSSAISPNGAVIAIGSYSYERSCATPGESALALWNAQRGNRIVTLHRGPALEASSQGTPAQEPPTEGDRIVGDVVNAVAFTPDSQYVAAGMSYGVVRLWSTMTGEQARIFEGHRYAVRAIAISPNGQTLASASSDNTIKLWNLQTGQLLRTMSTNAADGIVNTLLFSPDGQRLATATQHNTLQLWDATTGQLVRTLVNRATNLYPPMPLAFSANGQTLATADSDNSVKLWNARTGARQITLKGHSAPVRDLAFSPDSQRLATSDGTTARLWNLQTYATAHTLTLNQSVGHPVQPTNLGEVAFSPDGQTLAASTLLLPLVESEPIPRQGLTLWDVATGQSLEQIHGVGQFQFSPDGQFLLADGQRMQIWQPYSSLVQ
ncbi:GUN4 domain-containing protein [Nodosilinea sp. LEGE 06152]|uniref:GUN4 domain-containing protein n=1 Tax=Nodosilinea sp. LEGE 06152 TaxID=2777966 RepID=UPI00187E9F0B|nr:GUN4 domain-containing protein [Nodosilinea sp. LEGE 06152]MBE9159849.1 GUN4 domain-containing protein [Nodosilinea sp. LEGE 06152]